MPSLSRYLAHTTAALCITALWLLQPAFAQNFSGSAQTEVTTPQVKAQLLAYAPDGVEVGKTVMVGLQITHQPEWHTYWKNSGDSGQPTELQWTLPAGVSVGPVQWPTPKKIRIGTLANYGYEGTVLLPVPLEISQMFQPGVLSSALDIKLKAVWLVCKQECIPQEGEFALNIPLKGSTALSAGAFAAAKAASPVSVPNLDVGKSTARIAGDKLEFTVHNLPVAVRGQSLELLPETAEVLHNAAVSGKDWTQAWNGAVWTASMPLSAQRSASPAMMNVVLAAPNGGAYSVQAQVLGQWPSVAAPAQVPPELAAALKANAASQQAPVNAAGQAVNGADALGFWPALLLALLGGMILNLMPCVFPVLAIKVMGFTQQAQLNSRSGGHSLGGTSSMLSTGVAYTVGVVLSFVALGGLMLALRAGGQALGWGFQLQSPAVVALLAALFTLIGLNLLGVFEFANVLPSSIATLQAKNPQIDAFLSGVLAVAIASPCTAPFMGASLGFALGLPAWQALAIFAVLGVGMALPYLAASVVPAVARLLPRPGAWMDVFKKAMAFPMFATVAWLVWVLGQQSGVDGAGALLLLLVGLSMLVWALSLRGRARAVVAALSVALLAVFYWATGQYVTQALPEASATANAQGWQAWEPGKVDQLLAKGQPVFVDFTAAWCVTCQLNKKTTLNNAQVLADFNAKKVQLLRADWTRRDPAITQALASLGRQGVPVYVLYQPGNAPVVMSEILSATDVRAAISKL